MPGTFVFKPIEANLTHDTDWLGKMNPYCSFRAGNQKVKGPVCKNGGKFPQWNDAVSIHYDTNEPSCVVDLMDKDRITADDNIGTFVIDLQEIQSCGQVSKWYPLYWHKKPAGEILIETMFQPDMVMQPAPVIQKVQTYVQPAEIITTEIITEKVIEPVITEQIFTTETFSHGQTYNQGGLPVQGHLGGLPGQGHLGGLPGQGHLGGLPGQGHLGGLPGQGHLGGLPGQGHLGGFTSQQQNHQHLNTLPIGGNQGNIQGTQFPGSQFLGERRDF